MNEAETRAEHIDPQLAAAGWGVVEGSRILREYVITPGRIEGSGKRGKALIADYVLVYRNIKLAVDEAKAWAMALTEGVGQSKNYAGKLAVRFAFASNGQGIYETDMLTGVEREVPCYPSPQELWDRTFGEQDAWRDRFADVAYEDKGGSHPGRYYQDIACERVMAAIAAGCSRILLTLATGTGKTFIAFQIAWKLFHSRWNLTDWKKGASRPVARASCSSRTATSWPIRPTTPSPPSRRMPWCASRRRTSARRARCRRTAVCFLRSFRRL